MKKSDAEVSDLDVADRSEERRVGKECRLNRESLYKALREDAHPRFDTIMRVLKAMGLKLCITPCTVAEKKAVYKV